MNELERPIGTYLYGRRMYEIMRYWETAPTTKIADESPEELDYARVWLDADKVVYSRTLSAPSTRRTRIEHEFDPAAVRELKESSDRDITVGGAELAGQAMAAGLVDECHLILCPVIVGGGKHALPQDVRVQLELVSEGRFSGGVVHLHYRLV